MNESEILLYQTEDGQTKLEVSLQGDTVWLTQAQLCELFQRDKSVISRHIRNVFEEGELDSKAVVAFFATTATDGKSYDVAHYNLDVIISVGYRVKSHRGTQFRIWATQRLREYLVKGFAMNDEWFKNGGRGNYFEELLARIRDIRSSERVFWQKVLDLYATSIDYSPNTEISKTFFATIQNKMHWAAHGHTAAEIVYDRVSAELPNVGMTSFSGDYPKRTDTHIAKNYLNADELNVLNRLVTAFLEFAELQAIRQQPMTMKEWAVYLDDFLRLSRSRILDDAGRISHKMALEKADNEYEAYRKRLDSTPRPVNVHLIQALESSAKTLEKAKKRQPQKKRKKIK